MWKNFYGKAAAWKSERKKLRARKAAGKIYNQMLKLQKQNPAAAWEYFRLRTRDLPDDVRAVLGYDLAAAGESKGSSGFHFANGGKPIFPFEFFRWADHGVAFRINLDCFDGRNATLYLTIDGGARGGEQLAGQIEELSSGIADVQVIEKEAASEGPFHRGSRKKSWFQFRLDRRAIKPTIPSLSRWPSEPIGGYVFVLPWEGEFNIEFGEILDGKHVTLHRDDFCMK